MVDVVATYSDGGCITCPVTRKFNPSPVGGTWASCHVNARGERVWTASGVITAVRVHRYGLAGVTNNLTEYAAVLAALAGLPDGWSGRVYSDSKNTLGRFFWV